MRHPIYSRLLFFVLPILACTGCFGPFAVTGEVVDQNGTPLSNVKLHTTASVQTKQEFDAYGGETSAILPDGEFKVRCWTCSAMHLFFSKDGYHPKALDLAFFEWWTDHEVVLIKQGPPVDLDRFEADITFGPGNIETVMAVVDQEAKTLTLEELKEFPETTPVVRLRPSRHDDGALMVTTEEFMPVLEYVELDFSEANGAIQLYEPSDINFTYAYAEMVAAPKDGYTQSVRLQGKWPGQYYYFYCRIDGYYCKGAVSAPTVSQSGDQLGVSLSVEAFVNHKPNDRGLDDPRGYLR